VTSSDGTTIGFDRRGTGPGLVLVDGALSYRGSGPMAGVADALSSGFTVYTYDRRGRGESTDTAPHAVEREVEDLAAVIAAAGGSAYWCGRSSGAVLAPEAAASGLPITKLALYEPPLTVGGRRLAGGRRILTAPRGADLRRPPRRPGRVVLHERRRPRRGHRGDARPARVALIRGDRSDPRLRQCRAGRRHRPPRPRRSNRGADAGRKRRRKSRLL
jgi:alpha-beta hydrolase superfamily lysophospholipase